MKRYKKITHDFGECQYGIETYMVPKSDYKVGSDCVPYSKKEILERFIGSSQGGVGQYYYESYSAKMVRCNNPEFYRVKVDFHEGMDI